MVTEVRAQCLTYDLDTMALSPNEREILIDWFRRHAIDPDTVHANGWVKLWGTDCIEYESINRLETGRAVLGTTYLIVSLVEPWPL